MPASKRRISFSVQTTGLNIKPTAAGVQDRVIEIACTESVNGKITNRYYTLVNPEGAEISEGANAVHGLTPDMLEDEPTFAKIMPDLLAFIRGNTHTAKPVLIMQTSFVKHFLDYEIKRADPEFDGLGNKYIIIDIRELNKDISNQVEHGILDDLCKKHKIDQENKKLYESLCEKKLLNKDMVLALCKKHNMSETHTFYKELSDMLDNNQKGKHTLDSMCKQWGVDNSDRKYHEAKKDADLLMQVYLKMPNDNIEHPLAKKPVGDITSGFGLYVPPPPEHKAKVQHQRRTGLGAAK